MAGQEGKSALAALRERTSASKGAFELHFAHRTLSRAAGYILKFVPARRKQDLGSNNSRQEEGATTVKRHKAPHSRPDPAPKGRGALFRPRGSHSRLHPTQVPSVASAHMVIILAGVVTGPHQRLSNGRPTHRRPLAPNGNLMVIIPAATIKESCSRRHPAGGRMAHPLEGSRSHAPKGIRVRGGLNRHLPRAIGARRMTVREGSLARATLATRLMARRIGLPAPRRVARNLLLARPVASRKMNPPTPGEAHNSSRSVTISSTRSTNKPQGDPSRMLSRSALKPGERIRRRTKRIKGRTRRTSMR